MLGRMQDVTHPVDAGGTDSGTGDRGGYCNRHGDAQLCMMQRDVLRLRRIDFAFWALQV